MPKISVIIPMFNAEKYVEPAIETVLAQTFGDFELILIDDASTDRTLEIAKSFDDSRIRIVENEINGGTPGAARNVGIELAVGEFIYFMDDDDLLLPNCLEVLTAAIGDNDVVFDCTSLWATVNDDLRLENLNCRAVRRGSIEKVSPDLKQRIWRELVQHKMHYPPWLYLYRRKLLDNIRFPDCAAEDVFFLFDILLSTDRIVKIDEPLYIWRINENSASQTGKRLRKNIEGVVRLSRYIEQKSVPFGDPLFVENVTFSIVNGVLMDYALQFFKAEPRGASEETAAALRPIFGDDTMFVTNLIKGYMFKCLQQTKN